MDRSLFLDWPIVWIVVAVVVIMAIGKLAALRRNAPPRGGTLSSPRPAGNAPADVRPTQTAAPQAEPFNPIALAKKLEEPYGAASHPGDLLSNPDFEGGVMRLADPAVPLEQVVIYCVGANEQLAALGAEALARRGDSASATARVAGHLHFANVWTGFFMLRFLEVHADRPVIGLVLAEARQWWARNPLFPKMLGDFIDARLAKGEQPQLGEALDAAEEPDVDSIQALLDALMTSSAGPLREAFAQWHRTHVDAKYLQSVGRIWDETRLSPVVVEHELLSGAVRTCLQALERDPPQSFLIIGETGTGKTALFRLLASELMDRGWTVFEASAADVLSGQVYVGELEARVKHMQDNLAAARRVLWYVPNFHELYYAGRHRFSPNGALDLFLPAVEAGRICVVGEVQPAALQKLLQERPRVRLAFKQMKLEPLAPAETLELVQQLAERDFAPARVSVAPGVLREALDLARHYLSSQAQPGNVIQLLRATKSRLAAAEGGTIALGRDDLLVTLSQLTGLPRSVLDEREGLDAASLRDFFQQRVMGQPEAVNCLVDRVAMLKAGLTDPHRPIGVFLFAGPTGTGKTEVAKTLAEFMFGSQDRMIRLDMSEFQEPSSVARIVGDTSENREVDSLISRIRKQPFSVVLLDEFEKANPRVWDLFLQVFDDGRLTDAQGNVADFRYSIIVLTSNLGATQHRAASLGFNPAGGAFSEQQILRVIGDTFRPEFVNRLDRVLVFRPLSRTVMREILKKELRNVLQRRGFRNREWAVEWEESALEFLLDKGFTPDMGARPLRRAIEQYLLAPIAMTIVEHRFPQGDQFLFVRSDGAAIQVEFVDPDAEPAAADEPAAPPAELSLPPLVLAASGRDDERQFLQQRLASLTARLDGEPWIERKQQWLKQMSRADFWNSNERFEVLAHIELADRIEGGARGARSLSGRLSSRTAAKSGTPRKLLCALAQQLYVLNAALEDLDAGVASDVFLAVEPMAGEAPNEDASAWPLRLAHMYERWGHKRQMRSQVLSDGAQKSSPGTILMAFGGLGAHAILQREPGLHVFETPDTDGSFLRQSARVRVVPQPFKPRAAVQTEADYARACILGAPQGANNIIRRYREQPSPLVRDSISGWRTGRLDQVLGGEFDLMA
jgi:ATP-dependent Clp protease ATP-binding subunit ClpC